jgi:hypothetical protein
MDFTRINQIREKWKLRQERWSIEHEYQALEPEKHSIDEISIRRHYTTPKLQQLATESREFNVVYEGLIKSQPAKFTVQKLKDHFPQIHFNLAHDEGNNTDVIMTYFDNITPNDFKFLVQLVNNLGWFFSTVSINNQPWTKFDLSNLMITTSQPFDNITLQIEAKFDIEEKDVPNVLYHATPTNNVQKIKEIGIAPKSKSNIAYYGERIYLASDINNLEHILIPHLSEINGIKDWTILSVNTSPTLSSKLRWFKDPNYPRGYYTLTNIPPQSLGVVKQLSLK